MPRKSYLSITLSGILILFLLISGCGPLGAAKGKTPTTAASVTPVGITGAIKTGKTVAASSVNVPAGGGTIAVDKPGDPLDGLEIIIPNGAYSSTRQFKLSYALVESQTFGANFNPITPMITVDNGGDYSAEIISVRIPIKVAAGDFAMGFFYNEATKKLEGIPTISQDAESITIGTCHFSSFLISSIAKTKLTGTIDSGFRPGVDDWEFPNPATHIANGQICSGQSISAMWYYCTQPDGNGLKLYGRYDNNGDKPATPSLWQDDSLGIKFAAVVWTDIGWDSISRKITEQYVAQSDNATLLMFSFAMMMTGEPQLTDIYQKGVATGHAMIVYRVDSNHLYIADPEYPGGNTRSIEIASGTFKPYGSYDKISYAAKTAFVDWSKIGQRWTELKNKTIGNNQTPAYKLIYYDADNKAVDLKEGMTLSSGTFLGDAVLLDENDKAGMITALTMPEGGLKPEYANIINLKPGNNKIGFYVVDAGFQYVDFIWVNVIYGGLTLKPATQEAWPGKTITFDLELTEAAPKGAKFEWWVDGVLKKSGYDFGIDISFPDVGTHTVVAKVVDSAGKVLLQAQGTAVVKAQTTTVFVGNNLTALQKMKTFTGVFQGQCNIVEKTTPVYFSVSMWNWYGVNTPINITWSGASFSGTATSQVDGGTQTSAVSGTVSGDGKTLTSYTFTYSRKSNYTGGAGVVTQDNTINVQFKNIPIPDLVFESGSSSTCDLVIRGPEVKSYLVKYEQHFLTINSGKVTWEMTYLSDTINWNGTGLQDTPQIGLHFK